MYTRILRRKRRIYCVYLPSSRAKHQLYFSAWPVVCYLKSIKLPDKLHDLPLRHRNWYEHSTHVLIISYTISSFKVYFFLFCYLCHSCLISMLNYFLHITEFLKNKYQIKICRYNLQIRFNKLNQLPLKSSLNKNDNIHKSKD